ncbi:MAG: site-2 protease family protein [Candidatus Omnitrophota bacterium]
MLQTAAMIGVLLFSVIFHECAHGLVALWFGDKTAKEAGRLTLNPFKHIDPFGTLILPALLRMLGLFPIGWAKPVPVNFNQLRNPKRDMLWVGLAGPLTNILLALISVGLFHLLDDIPLQLRGFLITIVFVNLILAFFNLTPIPPLDGSRVLFSLLPESLAYHYAKMERFGIIIVLILLNFGLFNLITLLVFKSASLLGIDVYF